MFVPGLNDRADLRDKFFQELVEDTQFHLNVLYCETNRIGTLPKRHDQKYGRLLQNLLAWVPVRRDQNLLAVTLDSQNTARPVFENGKLYTWRKRRGGQQKQRARDKERHRNWSQRIDDLLRHLYPHERLHRKIWTVASHEHPCLQVIDVLANFCQRYEHLGLKQPPYYTYLPGRPQREWFDSFAIIKDRTWWIHSPKLRKARAVARLSKTL
jgi:hypothetical protein